MRYNHFSRHITHDNHKRNYYANECRHTLKEEVTPLHLSSFPLNTQNLALAEG